MQKNAIVMKPEGEWGRGSLRGMCKMPSGHFHDEEVGACCFEQHHANTSGNGVAQGASTLRNHCPISRICSRQTMCSMG